MANKQNEISAQTGIAHRKQVNELPEAFDHEPLVVAQRGKPLFVPGEGILPFSAYVAETQEFCPNMDSAGPDSVPAAPVPLPANRAPGMTRVALMNVHLLEEPVVVDALPTPVALPTAETLSEAFDATQHGSPAGKRSSRRFWLVGGLLLAIMLTLGLMTFSSLLLPRLQAGQPLQSKSAFAATSTPLPASTSGSTSMPQFTPVATQPMIPSRVQTPVATGPGSFIVTPDHFDPATCQVDNGYRCTATILYSQPGAGPLNWTAYGTNVATKFSPASGVLKPSKHQQVIIYMLTPCPNNGEFVFLNTSTNTRLMVSWSC